MIHDQFIMYPTLNYNTPPRPTEPNLTLPYLTKSLFTIPTQIEKWDDPEPFSTLHVGQETDKKFRLHRRPSISPSVHNL